MVPESVAEVGIETKSDHPREVRTAAELGELLGTYDLLGLQWTERVVVEYRAVPHSHPVLTLNTLNESFQLLTTYLHEQLHWWTAEHPGIDEAIGDTRQLWPTVPTADNGGSHTEFSTRLHLIVCHLERRAMQDVVGDARAAAVLHGQITGRRVYPWIYGQIRAHERVMDRICTAQNVWPDRLEPAS